MTVFGATDLAYAVVLGSAFGLGVCLLLSLAPRWGAASLSRRIAPYIRDITDPRGLTPMAGAPSADLGAWWQTVAMRVSAAVGGSASVQRRLHQAAWTLDVASFRGRQLAWSVAGVAAGGIAVVALALVGRATTAAVVLPPVCAVIAALLCGAHLSNAARARVARIEEELPTVLEFIALCLSAGEGILDSLRRVSRAGGGDLTAELRTVVLGVGTGSTLAEALSQLSRRLEVPAVARSIDQLVAAIDRGAPLAHVLHSQALDAREDAKRGLIERAGRKEIYMLIPLVFLILPLSVLFAVFPGIFILRLGIG